MARELDIGRLYDEHASFIARTIRRMTGDGAHVDDILQETFIVAYRRRSEFNPERAMVTTWMYGIASNLCRRHRRSESRWRSLVERLHRSDLPPPPAPPDRTVERYQAAVKVHQILGQLPFKQREAFILHELENLDCTSIGKLLGIPLGTVLTRLYHARRKFVKKIQRLQGSEGKK